MLREPWTIARPSARRAARLKYSCSRRAVAADVLSLGTLAIEWRGGNKFQ